MAHDVFISYSSADKTTADAIVATLEQNMVRCWIAPRDIRPGKSWGQSIIEALSNARVMILVFSRNANNSSQVEREVERAISREIPIVPFRIENVKPVQSLEYFLSSTHWLDAISPPIENHMRRLTKLVQSMIKTEYGPQRAMKMIPRLRKNIYRGEGAILP